MGEYHIQGGNRIYGQMKVGGSKNAILPILASTILNEGVSVIHNCPKISDTFISLDILKSLGCQVKTENSGSTIIVDSSGANCWEVPEYLVREMRSSFIFLGGVLQRFRKVKISYPGGCES